MTNLFVTVAKLPSTTTSTLPYSCGIFPHVLKEMYEADVLTDEAILKWAEEKEGADEEDLVFVKKCAALLEWLEEEDDDEEEGYP